MLPVLVLERLTAQMKVLNDRAAQAMLKIGAHACTDITGFGLLGHLAEIAETSGLSVEIDAKSVPTIPEAWEFAHMWAYPRRHVRQLGIPRRNG